MSKVKKFILVIFLIRIFAFAQDFAPVGTAVGQFLEIGLDARAIGMGEAYTSLVHGTSAVLWNPAGLALVADRGAFFSNNWWPAGINLSFVSVASRFGNIGLISIHLLSLQTDDMEITTLFQPEGTGQFFKIINQALGISYSRFLTDRVSFGLTMKLIKEAYWDYQYSTWAFDFGSLYFTKYKDIRIGLSIRNFGPDVRFSGQFTDYSDPESYQAVDSLEGLKRFETYSLPMNFRVGTSLNLYEKGVSTIVGAFDMVHSNNNLEEYNFGFEYSLNRKYFVRTGYQNQVDEGGLSFGFGSKFNLSSLNIWVNYAYKDLGLLSNSKQISIEMKWK